MPARNTPAAYKHDVQTSDLVLIRRTRELRTLRLVALVRLGVAAVMIVGAEIGVKPKWPEFTWVPWVYVLVAICAAVVLFTPAGRHLVVPRMQLSLLVVDVAAILMYKVISPDGAYVPLLVLALLPIMVVLDMSWRRATVALAIIAVTFTVEIFTDPVMLRDFGTGTAVLSTVVFWFLCCTIWLAVHAQGRQLDEITELSASRQALLIDLMSASDEQQRTISEYIHDGPLQSVLMARQDIVSVLKKHPDEALDRALAGLREATDQMREATFELHPAVLAGAGLARAVTQLAAANSSRSGITITSDVDYPRPDPVDPVVFGVARELLANVVRHSKATHASLKLKAIDGMCHLDVADDGVGMTSDQAARRLADGHIGLASQRTRIEAAGGTMTIHTGSSGTHVAITLPMSSTT